MTSTVNTFQLLSYILYNLFAFLYCVRDTKREIEKQRKNKTLELLSICEKKSSMDKLQQNELKLK